MVTYPQHFDFDRIHAPTYYSIVFDHVTHKATLNLQQIRK